MNLFQNNRIQTFNYVTMSETPKSHRISTRLSFSVIPSYLAGMVRDSWFVCVWGDRVGQFYGSLFYLYISYYFTAAPMV